MKKRISIITGAAGGIGKEFTKLMLLEKVDEIWAIDKNEKRLMDLHSEFGDKVVAISKDLTNSSELRAIGEMLEEEKLVIVYFVNNAGVGKMGSYADFSVDELERTISINCNAFVVLCSLCISYMERGSKIINVSSSGSFQPLPYAGLYTATKVFERYYSRALNVELNEVGITATAVCPAWVDTDLLPKEVNGKKIKYPGLVSPKKVAETALMDAKRGKDMSVCSMYAKFQHFMTKVLPQKVSMNVWLNNVKKNIIQKV